MDKNFNCYKTVMLYKKIKQKKIVLNKKLFNIMKIRLKIHAMKIIARKNFLSKLLIKMLLRKKKFL